MWTARPPWVCFPEVKASGHDWTPTWRRCFSLSKRAMDPGTDGDVGCFQELLMTRSDPIWPSANSVVSQHRRAQRFSRFFTVSQQQAWVIGDTLSCHYCISDSNPIGEALFRFAQRRCRHSITVNTIICSRNRFEIHAANTNSIKPNLFPPQWESYAEINLQKAFLLFFLF